MTNEMPMLNLDSLDLSDQDRALANQTIHPDGRLFASKPKNASGEAKYLWRMVVFGVSPKQAHQCLPITAHFDLDGSFSETMERAKELDLLAGLIEKAVPIEQRYGTLQWGRTLGIL